MSGKYRKFTPEFREEAARMVVETSRPIADVARELGINAERQTIVCDALDRFHIVAHMNDAVDQVRRRENRELRMKNDFLSKAAAYFAAEHR